MDDGHCLWMETKGITIFGKARTVPGVCVPDPRIYEAYHVQQDGDTRQLLSPRFTPHVGNPCSALKRADCNVWSKRQYCQWLSSLQGGVCISLDSVYTFNAAERNRQDPRFISERLYHKDILRCGSLANMNRYTCLKDVGCEWRGSCVPSKPFHGLIDEVNRPAHRLSRLCGDKISAASCLNAAFARQVPLTRDDPISILPR